MKIRLRTRRTLWLAQGTIALLSLTAGCPLRPSQDEASPARAGGPVAQSTGTPPPATNGSPSHGRLATGSAAAVSRAGDGPKVSVHQTATHLHGARFEPDRAVPPCDGWPKPDLALIFTGRQNGYIEPCGCTGFANAKGGLTRRFSLLQQLRQQGWQLLVMDLGNQVDSYGRQAELKFQTTVDVLKKMQYDAVGFGPDDLRLSFGELYAAIADMEDSQGPFLCANATLIDMPPKFRVFETPVGKVGVTAVLGSAEQAEVGTVDEIEFREPLAALREAVAEMQAQSCELLILLAYASLEQSRELAREVPALDVVVTAGGADEPPSQPETIEGSQARLIQVGNKAMHVGVLGLYRDKQTPLRYERVVLDARFEDAAEVLEAFADYQNTLKELGLEGLGLQPVPHPSGRTFVGSESCRECHELAYEIFQNSRHFDATLSLSEPTERSQIRRHHDPECLSCHVTGWNPQGYFPYESGYLDLEKSAHLHSTGCESCHGPGSAHVAAESGEMAVTEQQRQQLRQEVILTLEEAKTSKCFECHDLDNSPTFQKDGAFEEYWELVKHEGKY